MQNPSIRLQRQEVFIRLLLGLVNFYDARGGCACVRSLYLEREKGQRSQNKTWLSRPKFFLWCTAERRPWYRPERPLNGRDRPEADVKNDQGSSGGDGSLQRVLAQLHGRPEGRDGAADDGDEGGGLQPLLGREALPDPPDLLALQLVRRSAHFAAQVFVRVGGSALKKKGFK